MREQTSVTHTFRFYTPSVQKREKERERDYRERPCPDLPQVDRQTTQQEAPEPVVIDGGPLSDGAAAPFPLLNKQGETGLNKNSSRLHTFSHLVNETRTTITVNDE